MLTNATHYLEQDLLLDALLGTATDREADELYDQYEVFVKSKKYSRAYDCLEQCIRLSKPRNKALLNEMINLCINVWEKPLKAKPWLVEFVAIEKLWLAYLWLAHIEMFYEKNPFLARKYYRQAIGIKPKTLGNSQKRSADAMLGRIKNEIERSLSIKTQTVIVSPIKVTRKQRSPTLIQKDPSSPATAMQKESLKVIFTEAGNIPEVNRLPISTVRSTTLVLEYMYLKIQSSFDELICLDQLHTIDKFWYQIETAKRVLKTFHGRVLLCDEVGLGKTIEAGLIVKEYLVRGMVRRLLILTPSSLVNQWQEEMSVKFGVNCVTTEDSIYATDPAQFWKNPFIIASLHTAKSKQNFSHVTSEYYDLVVVDEAHHLRNRATLGWKLINQIQKKYILMLTATPIHNHLIELYNLITLLNPGLFQTEKMFKQEHLTSGSPRTPANKDKLRRLLREVMIRNTRSAIDIKLPKRFASTLRLDPSPAEVIVYQRLNAFLKMYPLSKNTLHLLLRLAGSCPFALQKSLIHLQSDPAYAENAELSELIALVSNIKETVKGKALLDLLRKNPLEKKIVFTQHVKSLDYISELLTAHHLEFVTFSGQLSATEKNASVAKFKDSTPILISTESGGEGRNLQFCRTIINFDLPWNPMRIEQRIGRLHRIGQQRDVFIFNLSIKETLEDYILDILDKKINLFEMVIGEIEPIIGNISEESNFEDIILDLWNKSSNSAELAGNFTRLGEEMIHAKKTYLETKALDTEIFGEDYET